MTFAEKLRNVLASAKQSAGASWSAERWLKTVNEFADAERPLGKDGKAKRLKNQTPINKMTEQEFLDHLAQAEHLAGIDVTREIGKCKFHFKAKGLDPSRMRIINWLNRADKTLSIHGRDAGARAADMAERSKEPPHGWREVMKEEQRAWTEKNGDSYDPPGGSSDDFFTYPRTWRDRCWRELGGGA